MSTDWPTKGAVGVGGGDWTRLLGASKAKINEWIERGRG